MKKLALAGLLASTWVQAETIDFETEDVGTVPSGWTVTMTHEGGAPNWAVESDPTSPSGAKVFAQLSDDPTSGRFPLAIYERAELTDGRLAVQLKPLSGRVDRAAGLVWRYLDENNYYVVRANALENNVVLYKVENGRRTSLSPVGREGEYGVKHTVPSERWSTLEVAFSGSTFTVAFDGRPIFEVEDATFAGAGKVGLWTKADSVTEFDAFEIESP